MIKIKINKGQIEIWQCDNFNEILLEVTTDLNELDKYFTSAPSQIISNTIW